MPQFDSYLFRGLLFFIAGQLLVSFIPDEIVLSPILFLKAALFVTPFLFIQNKYIYNGIGFYLILLCGAWLNGAYYQLAEDHYSVQNTDQIFTILIDKVLKENPYAYRYYGTVKRVGKTVTTGKILVLQEKDSVEKPFTMGTRIVTLEAPNKIGEPKNPGTFNYAAYLNNQKVYDQLYLKANTYILLAKQEAKGLQRLYEWRTKSIQKIRSSALSSDASAYILALVFGEKTFLEKEIRTAYSQTGVVHLLAILGLHEESCLTLLGGYAFLLCVSDMGNGYEIVSDLFFYGDLLF